MKVHRIGWLLLLLLVLFALGTPAVRRMYYRVDHLPLILSASKDHGISPHLIAAVIFTESRFDNQARSNAGAVGLMQLMPETAAEMAQRLGLKTFDLMDPETNIQLGVTYLKELQGRFSDPEMVLAAYNAGPTVVQQWQSERKPISYAETRHYIRSVLRHKQRLELLYPEWSTP